MASFTFGFFTKEILKGVNIYEKGEEGGRRERGGHLNLLLILDSWLHKDCLVPRPSSRKNNYN